MLPVDVISVDSAMVYRGMDIGTAKPDAATVARVPHALIDILDPAETYSAAAFRADALAAIRRSHATGRLPLLVGGTMLYFRALEEGLSALPPADAKVRARLNAEAAAIGWEAMHDRLRTLDPEAAARIHQNDVQRLQRALEILHLTGRSLSELQQARVGPPPGLRMIRLGLQPPERDELHRRIRDRFHRMLELGFEEEVAGLRQRGDLALNQPAMRAVGYRQMWLYQDGCYGRDEMVRRGIAATRQYAKRQLTWLRHDDTVRVLCGAAADVASSLGRLAAGELSAWRGL